MKKKAQFVKEPVVEYIPAKTISIHEAKTNFSKLVKRAEAGETIYIGAYGKPEVVLSPADQKNINASFRNGFVGCMKNRGEIPKYSIEWTDDELYEMFYSFMTREEFDKL